MKKHTNKLYELRKFYGLTQSELAAEIKYSEVEISKIEFGETEPTYELIVKLAERYPSINLNWWFKGKSFPFDDSQDKEFKKVYAISESIKREHYDYYGDEYRDALEDFLKIQSGSDVRPRHLLKTDLNVYEYQGKIYLVVKTEEIKYLVRERILKCLWLTPKNLLFLFLKGLPTSKIESILEVSSRLSSKQNMLISVLVSQFSPHTISLYNFFNQYIVEIELLRSLFIENKIMERLLIYTNDMQTDEVTREGKEFRIYDVTEFM